MHFFGRPLVSSVNNVVNFFVSPTVPDPPCSTIPPPNCFYDADSWWRRISEDIQSAEDRDNAIISEVRWFKDVSALEHESVIVTVEVEQHPFIAFLTVERSTRKELVKTANKWQLIPEVRNPTNEFARRLLRRDLRDQLEGELNLIKNRDTRRRPLGRMPDQDVAFDTITGADISYGVAPTPESLNADCLKLLLFDKPSAPKFLLRDLSIMVREIHNCQPDHSLIKHNSCWFARTLVDVIMAMKMPTIKTPDPLVHRSPGWSIFGHNVRRNPTEVDKSVGRIENAICADDQRIANLKVSDEISIARLTEEAISQNELADTGGELADTWVTTHGTVLRQRRRNVDKSKKSQENLKEMEMKAQLLEVQAETAKGK